MSATLRRYRRHLLIPEIGLDGQRKLGRSRVLVVGAGGLGAPALLYLAAAGVGRLGIADDDRVDVTNLQRQVIYMDADVGRPKAQAAADRIAALNPHVAVDPIEVRLDATNARDLVALYDVVIDATDNFASRYLLSDACRLENKPDVYGSIFRFDGQVSVFAADGPCYRCLFPEPPPAGTVPTCAEGGVLGVLAGLIGAWQANEALKVLLGIGEPLVGRLLLLDALSSRHREIGFGVDPACARHGDDRVVLELGSYESSRVHADVPEVDADDLDAYLESHPDTVVLDVGEPANEGIGEAPRSIRMPAGALDARLWQLDSAREYVVACRVGSASRAVIPLLRDAGFARLLHLRGGLLSYAAARYDPLY